MSGFEVASAFEPLARLVKRDGTRDGAVPLRVAQACVPLLEGNALGHHVSFRRRLTIEKRLGRIGFASDDAYRDVDRAHRAALPVLAARGFVDPRGPWTERLTKRWWWTERGVLRVWTGLVVRARPSTWLHVSDAGSHAPASFGIRAAFLGGERFVPLVLDLEDATDGARLEGEVATLVAVKPDVAVEIVSLDEASELAEAHAAFYDAKYFATKKGEVTRKYRRVVTRADAASVSDSARVRIAHLAGPAPDVNRVDHVTTSRSLVPVPAARGERLDVVHFRNAVPFSAHYDRNTLDVVPDRTALERGAREVEAVLSRVLGERWIGEHRGAVLYLTKYVTPHPHGEPHFFVKPWAFTETPRGWSSVLDGVRGSGFDVMRGVIWSDRFHATPAVFDLPAMKRVRVAAGARIVSALPVPRSLLEETFETIDVDPR